LAEIAIKTYIFWNWMHSDSFSLDLTFEWKSKFLNVSFREEFILNIKKEKNKKEKESRMR